VRYIAGDIPARHLGLPPVLSDVIMEKRGLVLVVGATGSGKSTTIASMLDHRNEHRSGHILTIEDPIEYLFKHKMSIVNQREIGSDTVDWHNALRNAMRQAPDCILIGEIRDRETMAAALAYAQTGHLCLATLHANNAYHALNRIFSFFPTDGRTLLSLDLAATLKCIISQRLVKRPDGGRIPAVEILLNSRQVTELIERARSPASAKPWNKASPRARAPSSRTCSASTRTRPSPSKKPSPTPTRRPTCPGSSTTPSSATATRKSRQAAQRHRLRDHQPGRLLLPRVHPRARQRLTGQACSARPPHAARRLTTAHDHPTLDLTRALIARPSVTPEDAGCLDLIAARLAPLGFVCERIDGGGVSNLWARRGTAAPSWCSPATPTWCPPARSTPGRPTPSSPPSATACSSAAAPPT
jgi:energy-coupling factor transporter ATP-binding protein EcfA2